MTVDPKALERYKRALAKLSLEEIQRRLDRSVIIRPWRRDLAEAEGERREQAARAVGERAHVDAADERQRRKLIALRVWGLVGLAIVAAVAVIWTTVRPS